MNHDKIKKNTAVAAVDSFVKDGIKIGLGTGSTAIHAVRHIGTLLEKGKLKNIMAVSTSFQTTIECEKNGIPLYSMNSRQISGRLDLAIDGADEVDSKNRCIKGGGGALLLEKIVAYSSDIFVLVIEEPKLTEKLGCGFPLPVEVVPESWLTVSLKLEKLGAKAKLREAVRKIGPVVTDNGNFILDAVFSKPVDAALMEIEINRIPGVAENGFFTWKSPDGTMKRPVVFIGMANGKVERRD